MKYLTFVFLLFMGMNSFPQTSLPVIAYKSSELDRPLVLYISGDGGWNSFSTALLSGMNKAGYPIVGLNAKTYFWSRKKPDVAAAEISSMMNQFLNIWNLKSAVVIGYSFGADVAPFIVNRLKLNGDVKQTILMSPSKKTDFEVHFLGMMGFSSSEGQSVPDEINKVAVPVTIILGSDENDFPLSRINVKSLHVINLSGGHHYDGNVSEVIAKIIENIK